MSLNGLIIYNGSLYSEKFIDYANMLKHAAIKKGHTIRLIKNNEIHSLLKTNEATLLSQTTLKAIDYIIFTDKDIYLAHHLEAMGYRLFNSAHATEVSDDKIKSYQTLAKKNLPIPKTLIAPKNFINPFENNANFLNHAIEYFNFPFVIKEAFGSFGEQVYLVHNKSDVENALNKIGNRPFMCQEFITSSYGKDIRLQVVGDDVITTMKRSSEIDFRANITSGGKMDTYTPSEAEKSLAITATKALGLDFAGVDLLFGENSKRVICEVNSNAHIRNLLDCTGVNVADSIIEYIDREVKK